jgi:hypothetical protein
MLFLHQKIHDPLHFHLTTKHAHANKQVHAIRLPVQWRIVLQKYNELIHIHHEVLQISYHLLQIFIPIIFVNIGEKETLGGIEF